jgi:hypothetical protein
VLPGDAGGGLPSPVFLPRRRVDGALRDGASLPAPLGPLLAGAARAAHARSARRPATVPGDPVAVVPGSLGSWAAEEQTP